MTISQEFTVERLRALWTLSHEKVVWRHDVDYDVQSAAMMAAEEYDAGIQSTYFIRVRGPYNVFASDVRGMIDVISGCGHTLGLHLDTGLPRTAIVDIDKVAIQAERDYRILKREFSTIKRRLSYHAPPFDLRWRDLYGFRVSDAPQWRDRYVADSRGVWREPVEDMLATGEPLTVNTHPEWYFLPEPERTILWKREQSAP